MKKLLFATLTLGMFFSCADKKEVAEEATENILPDPGNGGIHLPENFAATVVVDTLSNGRHLVVGEDGIIYARLSSPYEGSGLVALKDTNGDGRADIIKGVAELTGTGIELHKGFLYYSSNDRIYRSPLSEDHMGITGSIDTIALLVGTDGHSAKPFTFDGAGNMYVNIGSLSNACEQPLRTGNSPGENPCTELEMRAGIWQFKDDQMMQDQKNAKRYATGIRNAMGITWDGASNSLYATQHGRDDLHRYWPELFTEAENVELPAEEFLQINDGDDFGWPYCYWNHFDGKKYLNPEYGGDGKKQERCEGIKPPVAAFPGHWGPNDLLFYKGNQFPEKYKNGAFIAFHGSWNRLNHAQDGYRVVFVPMKDGKATGPYEDFATGFIGNKEIMSPGEAKYRPCGLAEGPDGSLYIIDSMKGRIWRVKYYKDGVPDVGEAPAEEKPLAAAQIIPDSPGKRVYDANCRACHQANGDGAPGMIPPVAGTDWVTGDKTRLINVLLKGLSDPVEINGKTYQVAMPAQTHLGDQEIADVLTFIRSNFGNNADAVTIDEVKKLRM
ncbi:MAG: PQQ-dependent sugar dehydrogenase [Saprospiraceae bacterium]|nr:PQQ-dependent sugar dehydrogenase [Saprospiraceae bacterium]